MKTKALFIWCLLLAPCLMAQTTTWYFGNNGGLSWPGPVPAPGSAISSNEGSAVVTDAAGNIMFYTDGIDIWDHTHSVINAGSPLNGGPSATHAALIVPVPTDNCGKFLVFTTQGVENSPSQGVYVALVAVTGTAPNYSVTKVGDAQLRPWVTEKLASTRDNGNGYWLVAHDYSETVSAMDYYVWHITSAVLSHWPSASSVATHLNSSMSTQAGILDHSKNPTWHNGQGQMKFTKDGSRLASAVSGLAKAEMFDFNIANGTISNGQTIDPIAGGGSSGLYYGLEFSPNGNLLYLGKSLGADPVELMQFDLTVSPPTMFTVASVNTSGSYGFNQLQLGVDDIIYIAGVGTGNSTLSMISNPDVSGALCNYAQNSVSISGSAIHGLPTVITGSSSCQTSEPPSGCNCEGKNVSLSRVNAENGMVQMDLFISSGVPIKEIRSTILSWNTSLSSPLCRDYCNITPSNSGAFNGDVFDIPDFIGSYGPYGTGISGSWGYDMVWTTTTPREINDALGLNLEFPPVLSLECCEQQISFCVRIDLIDEDCQICSFVICSDGGGDGEGKKIQQGTPPEKSSTINQEAKPAKESATIPVSVYPNPNKGAFTLQSPETKELYFEVIDTGGKVVSSGYFRNSKLVEIPGASGVFVVKVTDGQNIRYERVLVN